MCDSASSSTEDWMSISWIVDWINNILKGWLCPGLQTCSSPYVLSKCLMNEIMSEWKLLCFFFLPLSYYPPLCTCCLFPIGKHSHNTGQDFTIAPYGLVWNINLCDHQGSPITYQTFNQTLPTQNPPFTLATLTHGQETERPCESFSLEWPPLLLSLICRQKESKGTLGIKSNLLSTLEISLKHPWPTINRAPLWKWSFICHLKLVNTYFC